MKVLSEGVLVVLGFCLGLWYLSMLLLPLFYGIPRALVGFFRGKVSFKGVLAWLIAPVIWTAFFLVVFLAFAFFWNRGFEYLRTDGGFNVGQVLGTFMLMVNALFNKKTRADMSQEFDEFVLPFRK